MGQGITPYGLRIKSAMTVPDGPHPVDSRLRGNDDKGRVEGRRNVSALWILP